jgi:hypothetical protein
MGLFNFGKKKGNGDKIIKKNGVYRCPYCNADLAPMIESQAYPVLDVFRRMGPLGSSVTLDTCKKQLIKSGVECTCGKSLKGIDN